MLGEITFQRKKEANYCKPASDDSIKTIYDYILKQDVTIKKLEGDIKSLKEQYNEIITQTLPKMQIQFDNKLPEINNIPTIQSQEDIKETVMSMITNDNQETVNLLRNEMNDLKKTSQNNLALIDQKITQIEQEHKQTHLKDKDTLKNEVNIIDVIKKNNKAFDNAIKSIKDDYMMQISKINKRMNVFDNDFDRLIQSLKTQFQTVNETLMQLEDKSTEFNHAKNTLDVNASILKDLYTSINQLKGDVIRTETIITSISMTKQQEQSTDRMNNEMMTLRQDINEDMNMINKHILNELEKHGNEIKVLTKSLKNDNSNILPRESSFNDLCDPWMTIEQELDKKANIDQLNYAMEAQSKINDALCSVSRIARWSWSNGQIDSKGMIIWSVQNINTSLDLYVWNSESSSIIITLKGIYQITTGSISSNAIRLFILINGLEVTPSSNDSIDETPLNTLITINDYFAISEGSQLQIGLICEDDQDNPMPLLDFDCYLEIRKII